jgi:hypothetical protein
METGRISADLVPLVAGLQEEEARPVSLCAKVVAWAFIVLYNAGLAFYVCLFGYGH